MSFGELLSLFGASLAALAATAVAAGLVGAFLYVRGAAFQGLVLPQLASCGVALGYVVAPALGGVLGTHGHTTFGDHAHSHAVSATDLVHVLGATAGVALGLLALTRLARRPGSEAARLAAAFALGSGGTALAAHLSPQGGLFLDALLAGEALAVGWPDAWLVMSVAGAASAFVLWRWRDLTLVTLDRAFATVLGARVGALDAALGAATAAVIVFGTLALGPLPLFALLVLPPLGCRSGARSMAAFLARCAGTGLAGATAGAALSFGLDLPLGAAVVAGAALIAGLCRVVSRQ